LQPTKSGAGKSALINAVFGVEATVSNTLLRGLLNDYLSPKAVSHRTPGEHDINEPLSFPDNDRIIIHDSQGFEGGEEANVEKVFDFIDRRSKMPALGDQLHAIWLAEATLLLYTANILISTLGFALRYLLQGVDHSRLV
jgi:predicted GTPase